MNTQAIRWWIPLLGALLVPGCAGQEPYADTAGDVVGVRLPPAWTSTPTATASKTPHPTCPPTRTATHSPTASTTPRLPWVPCSSAPPSQLQPGQEVYVSFAPELPSRLRDQPSTGQGEVVGMLNAGESATIVKGPECGEGMVCWYVRATATGTEGWTPEGTWDSYWLLPLLSIT